MRHQLVVVATVVISSALATWVLPTQETVLTFLEDKENVAVGRLDGTWVPSKELSERLGTKDRAKKIVFKSEKNPAFLVDIPKKVAARLANQGPIYLAGSMRWDEMELTFVLSSNHGNPHIFAFPPRGGDPLGDAESCNFALVPAKDPKNDLLFMGADFTNEPYRAFQRAEAPGAPEKK